jgi:hypothetical protein
MRDEILRDDPKTLWQNQPTGAFTMTLRLVRWKARELRAKTRKKQLAAAAGPLAVIFFYVFGIREFPGLAPLLHPLFALALVWSVVGLYVLSRGMWSPVMPGDAGISTGLAFCREEIERRRDLLGRRLLWSLAPLLLAIGTVILALAMVGTKEKGLFPNGLPFLILVALWIVGYFIVRAREQRELERELAELNDLEAENGQ